MHKIYELQGNLNKVLFLGNNDESTDQQVEDLALQNCTINHGLVIDPAFAPTESGYYHTTIADVPFGQLFLLAQRFNIVIMLDQPQSQWTHWKCISATFKLMCQLEDIGQTTVFRNNRNSKKILYWQKLVHSNNKSFCIYPWINFNNDGKVLRTCARDQSSVTAVDQLKDWSTDTS